MPDLGQGRERSDGLGGERVAGERGPKQLGHAPGDQCAEGQVWEHDDEVQQQLGGRGLGELDGDRARGIDGDPG
jgi:hypothetical protein